MLGGMPALAGAMAGEPEAAARLCQLAAWHPLALELAAKRLAKRIQTPARSANARPVHEFNENLHNRLHQLKTGEGPQDSLEANFALSYDGLDEAGQTRWRALAVFTPTGFGVPAAAALWQVAGAEAEEFLAALEEASLLMPVVAPVPGARYRLHDLLRDYAAEKLRIARDSDAARRAHANFLVSLFGDHFTDDPSSAPEVTLELDNLRAAAEFASQIRDGSLLGQLAYQSRNWQKNIFFTHVTQLKAGAGVQFAAFAVR